MHTVLVVGGDLAERCGRLLAAQGHHVWALRRRQIDEAANKGLRRVSADITVADSLTNLPRTFSHVVVAVTPAKRDAAAYRAIFVEGVRNLIRHLDPDALQRLLFISSTAVYGASDDWVDEHTVPAPTSPTGQALVDAETSLMQELGQRAMIFRLSGLYGPGRLQLLDRLLHGRAEVHMGHTHWANRFHIEDAARACCHLLTMPGGLPCYVGTDDTPRPLHVLYDSLAAMLNAPPPLRTETPLSVESKRLSNRHLKASGFRLDWPDALEGYQHLIGCYRPAARV